MSLDVRISEQEECPHCNKPIAGQTLHEQNITHNLADMAREANIYYAIRHPELIENPTYCKTLIPIIQAGLQDMVARPEHYKKFDSPNGRGLYNNFVPRIQRYLDQLNLFDDGIVTVSR